MFCKYCGNKIEDNSQYCSKCGKPANDDIIELQNNVMPYQQPPNGYMQNGMYQPNMYQQPYQQVPPPYIQPTIVNFQQPIVPTANNACTAAFICGIVGFFILPWIFGIAAVICGIVGVATFDEQKNTNKWQGITGLVLGVVNILWAIFVYAYILQIITNLFS